MNTFNISLELKDTYQRFPENDGRPLIGITCNAGGEDYSIRQRYCEQVERSGGVPVLLAPTSDTHVMAQQLDSLDAIIFSGGGDHNPLWMGEEPSSALGTINAVRDYHELLLCRMAYDRQLPILGICRGMQTIAIALGGHVQQDIKTPQAPLYRGDVPTICSSLEAYIPPIQGGLGGLPIKHSQDAPKNEPTHSIEIVPGTILHNIYEAYHSPSLHNGRGQGGWVFVNSFHHQAVDRVGEKMRVSAYAPDGVIEAMESAEHKPILAVQWHPEQLDEDGQRLFLWLTSEAKLFREAKALHSRILTLDSHCDTPMLFPQNVDFLTRDPRILYDLHKMHDGHIDAVMMVCYLPQGPSPLPFLSGRGVDTHANEGATDNIDTTPRPKREGHGGGSFLAPFGGDLSPKEYADFIFDCIHKIKDRCPEYIGIARTVEDLWRNKREGKKSIMLGIENGIALDGDIRNLQHFRDRGIVYITLCHNGDNEICDSAKGSQTHGGLSEFGKEVVREMNRLGIAVDLSHAAESSFYDALKVSSKPIICSHSNCRALCDHPRNITDDQMRALAAAGGVMQLTLYHGFISPSLPPRGGGDLDTSADETHLHPLRGGEPNDTSADVSPSDNIDTSTPPLGGGLVGLFFAHLEHAIDIMGIDHVGIGTDFDGDGGIPGIANASELINITRELLRRGYSHEDIRKIWGGNITQLLAEL